MREEVRFLLNTGIGDELKRGNERREERKAGGREGEREGGRAYLGIFLAQGRPKAFGPRGKLRAQIHRVVTRACAKREDGGREG